MRPLPFEWPYGLIFWAVTIWAFLPERNIVRTGIEGGKESDSKDSGSLQVLLGGMGIAFFLAYALAFVRAWQFPPETRVLLYAVGIAMIFFGSLLRRYCWRTLGQYFTGDVRARADQPVIRTGPYRLVRHPSYTAGMMMNIGVGVALGSWLSFAILTIGTIATYLYRVRVEERALLDTIGEPYRSYMRESKRFIPYIV
ncbi:MAG TPA: isoprenylcysteine carboxylmethyltransferase family protein [Gemmatimonadaceae bacterium]|jgi:protein-S-isoprenylcysteine O-methyltransferase Ste14|nr:isoprenylcysteine carboxylmethyltransferase family protein [Gemmatimonadaceae bacterium]